MVVTRTERIKALAMLAQDRGELELLEMCEGALRGFPADKQDVGRLLERQGYHLSDASVADLAARWDRI